MNCWHCNAELIWGGDHVPQMKECGRMKLIGKPKGDPTGNLSS